MSETLNPTALDERQDLPQPEEETLQQPQEPVQEAAAAEEEIPVQEADPVEETPDHLLPLDAQEPEIVNEEPMAQIPQQMPVMPGSPEPVPAPVPVQPKKPLRKRIFWPIRALLQILSLALSLVLTVSLLTTVLVADLRQMSSGDGLKTILSAAMSMYTGSPEEQSPPAPAPAPHRIPAGLMARSGGMTIPGMEQLMKIPFVYDEEGNITGVTGKDGEIIPLPENVFHAEGGEGAIAAAVNPETGAPIYVFPSLDDNGNLLGFITRDGSLLEVKLELNPNFQLPPDLEMPKDFTDVDALTEWAYKLIKQYLGEQATVTQDSIKTFIQKSTVTDYLVDKVNSYANDILLGEFTTMITTEEIMNLVQENRPLLQEQFGVEITQEQMDTLSQTVEKVVVEQKLNEKIQETVTQATQKEMEIPGVGNLSVQQILNAVTVVLSQQTQTLLMGLCGIVILLLLLANFYNLPGGLSWTSMSFLFIGAILSAPVVVLQTNPDLLTLLPAEMASLQPLLASFVEMMAPIHYGTLAIGGGLLLVSIIWRIIRSVLWKKRVAAAAVAA